MAQVYSSGPVDVYVSTAGGLGAVPFQYFGTGRRKPQYRVRRGSTPVQNDLAANMRHDKIYGGQGIVASVQFNRFNWSVYDRVKDAMGTVSGLPLSPGRDQPGDRGTLVHEEGVSYQLLLAYRYASKAAFNRGGEARPAGVLIFGATLMDDSDEPGWGDFATSLAWESDGIYDPTMAGTGGVGGYDVWRYINLAEWAALPTPD